MADIKTLEAAFGIKGLEPIMGDVSSRAYFRAPAGVVMLDIDEGADARRAKFIAVSERLRNAGLLAPEIYAHDEKLGAVYLQDLGKVDLFQNPSEENYAKATETLLALQHVNAQGLTLYSAAIYEEELSRLMRFYLAPLGIEDQGLLDIARPTFEALEEQADCFVHVDFHAQNLMLSGDEVGLIDFQDARKGHKLYDLASFIDDIRFEVPRARADKIKARVFDVVKVENADYYFHVLSVQRLLKIIGIFARQSANGRAQYGALIPRCFALLEVRLEHPQLALWQEWVNDVVPINHSEFVRAL